MNSDNAKMPAKAMLDEMSEQERSDDCSDPCLFHLRDSTHEFTVGLLDMLKCLKYAETNGYVPAIDNAWWNDVRTRFELANDITPPKTMPDDTQVQEYCDDCGEMCFFSFHDNTHRFTIGLTKVLKCLIFAENEKIIPEITGEDNKWWCYVTMRFRWMI